MDDGVSRDAMRDGLRRAAGRAAGRGQIAGTALISFLCAGALAPLVTIDPGLGGPVAVAVTGAASSVGGNIMADVLKDVAGRLRGQGKADSAVSAQVVEEALAHAIQGTLDAGGVGGAAMREFAAGMLREADAVRAVVEGAAAAGPDATEALARGLAGLGEQFGEFAGVAADLRSAVRMLERELTQQAAQRRALAERDRESGLMLGRILTAVEALAPGERRFGAASPSSVDCPYPGLAPFSERDAGLFHGRSQMIRSLIRAVDERREAGGVLVVLGASGAGKSSLLRAGLIPALARDESELGSAAWPTRVLTPTERPLRELTAHLAELSGRAFGEVEAILTAEPRRAAELARQVVSRRAEAAPGRQPVLVLVVDQFEELFMLGVTGESADAERNAFVEALAAMARPAEAGPAAVVVVAVRGDFLDKVTASTHLATAVADGPFVVEPMTRAELRQAVAGPAAKAGVAADPDLVEAVVQDVFRTVGTDGSGVLPLVSQAMVATWRLRNGSNLTLDAYHRAGGLANAVDRSAEQAYDSLADSQQRAAARAMFLVLVRLARDGRAARRIVQRAELYRASGVSESECDAVIRAFVERRLLMVDGDNVQICHDVLLDAWRRLSGWLRGEAVDLTLYGEVISDAEAWRDGRHDRYGRRRLLAVEIAADRWRSFPERYPPLPEVAEEFLAASRRATRRAATLRLGATVGLAVLTIVALVAATDARRNAAEARRYAAGVQAQHAIGLSRQLAAQSLVLDQTNPLLARQLAASAWRESPTSQAGSAMVSLLTEQEDKSMLIGHQSEVRTLAFSSDGKYLASADGLTVRLWNPATREEIGGPLGDVSTTKDAGLWTSVAFNPRAAMVAGGNEDGKVWFWEPGTRRMIGSPIVASPPAGGLQPVVVAFSPDGALLATVYGHTLRIWNMATRQEMGASVAVSTGEFSVTAIAFGPNGRTVTTAGEDGSVHTWDLSSGLEIGPAIAVTTSAPPGVAGMAVTPDGSVLATADADGMLRQWDTATHRQIRSPIRVAPLGGVSAVSFNPAGTLLATTVGTTVRLWNPVTGQEVGGPVVVSAFGDASALAFSPDGTILAVGSNDATVRLLNPVTDEPLGNPIIATSFGSQTLRTAYSPDGKVLATADLLGKVRLWDAATGQKIGPTLTANADGGVNDLAFDPDGELLAAAEGNGQGRVLLWDPATGRQTATIVIPNTSGSTGFYGADYLAFNPSGTMLATADGDGTVRLWDPASGRELGQAISAHAGIACIAFSPDGKTLAIGGDDGAVWFWNVATGGPTGVRIAPVIAGTAPAIHALPVLQLAFDPVDGKLAVGYEDRVVLRNPHDGSPVGSPIILADVQSVPTQGLLYLAFSPDGSTLATGQHDGDVRLWNPASGKEIGPPIAVVTSGGELSAVTFDPTGATLMTAVNSGPIQQWHLAWWKDPYRTLCAEVGAPAAADWVKYAAGETEPATCG